MSYNKTFDSAWIEKKGYKAAPNLDTSPELAAAVDALRKLDQAGMVPAKDQNFTQSLCNQHKQKGGLSEKQAYWVRKLMKQAMGVEDDKPAPGPSIKDPVPAGAHVYTIAIRNLLTLFKKAGEKLKKPRLVVVLPESKRTMKVYPSKYGNAININLMNPYRKVGWIKEEDNLLRLNKPDSFQGPLSEELVEEIVSVLKELAADPVAATAKYGKAAASCCYCNLALSDPKSLDKGYGPVCAKNWGLPWG